MGRCAAAALVPPPPRGMLMAEKDVTIDHGKLHVFPSPIARRHICDVCALARVRACVSSCTVRYREQHGRLTLALEEGAATGARLRAEVTTGGLPADYTVPAAFGGGRGGGRGG